MCQIYQIPIEISILGLETWVSIGPSARIICQLARDPISMREAVEITEDLLVDSLDRTRRVLDKRRAHGIRVAIDDFECGYSALSYLRDL